MFAPIDGISRFPTQIVFAYNDLIITANVTHGGDEPATISLVARFDGTDEDAPDHAGEIGDLPLGDGVDLSETDGVFHGRNAHGHFIFATGPRFDLWAGYVTEERVQTLDLRGVIDGINLVLAGLDEMKAAADGERQLCVGRGDFGGMADDYDIPDGETPLFQTWGSQTQAWGLAKELADEYDVN